MNTYRGIRRAGHVARMGTEELYTGFCLGDMTRRTVWERDLRIILKWFFKKLDVEACT